MAGKLGRGTDSRVVMLLMRCEESRCDEPFRVVDP